MAEIKITEKYCISVSGDSEEIWRSIIPLPVWPFVYNT